MASRVPKDMSICYINVSFCVLLLAVSCNQGRRHRVSYPGADHLHVGEIAQSERSAGGYYVRLAAHAIFESALYFAKDQSNCCARVCLSLRRDYNPAIFHAEGEHCVGRVILKAARLVGGGKAGGGGISKFVSGVF